MIHSFTVTNQTDPIGNWYLTDESYCDPEQSYKENPFIAGFSKYHNEYSGDQNFTITGFTPAHPGERFCGYIYEMGNGEFINFADAGTVRYDSGNAMFAPYISGAFADTNYSGSVNTNIPIFASQSDASLYMNAATEEDAVQIMSEKALNWLGEIENQPDTEDWYIYNTYEDANIDLGIVTYTGSNPTGRYEIIKAKKVVGYMVDPENSLEFRLLGDEIVGSVYSSANQYTVQEEQHDPANWTRGKIEYSGPFYKTLEYMPDGNYTIGVTLDTNINIFGSYEDALGNLAGTVPDEDAINYGSTGNPEIASNETGQKELITEFGSNESENVFSHDYIMNRTSLAAIGGKFFDTSILDALLEGLKIYGNNPMESVLSCIYFPFDLSSVCTASSVSSIFFGSYEMTGVSGVSKVGKRNGYKELGSTFIKPTFYNWLDYAAMHIYLYLPYIGFVELDINKYLNKWMKIIYMIDIHSGETEVSLTADGLLTDTYSGQIGIKQPLTYNDLSTYYQSQITALRNGVMTAIGLPVGGGLTGAQIGGQAGPYGAVAGAAVGATLGEMVAKPYAAYQARNILNTKPPLFSKGGYTSEIGANMPQYAFLVFMYNDVEIPENELLLYGKPSNKSGSVGSFSGFLSCSYVQLQCSGATEGEKNEILSYLQNGIYI